MSAPFHVSRFTSLLVACVACLAAPRTAPAQETGTPVFHAPYRTFSGYEFGGGVSFQRGSQTGIEGHYRRALGRLDLGVRAGAMTRDAAADGFLFGVQLRHCVISETTFPLRGALVAGVGLDVSGATNVWVPVGLSLGRRLNVEHSPVSLIPYIQPTGLVTSVGDNVGFALALGLDVRLSTAFELRLSGSFGTAAAPEGVALTATWLR